MPQATSTDSGTSLFNVNMLRKKNHSLRTEIENHEPRIILVCNNGQKLIDEKHEDSPQFQKLIGELKQKYQDLKGAVENREKGLKQSEKVQQVCANIKNTQHLKKYFYCIPTKKKAFSYYFSISSMRTKPNRG